MLSKPVYGWSDFQLDDTSKYELSYLDDIAFDWGKISCCGSRSIRCSCRCSRRRWHWRRNCTCPDTRARQPCRTSRRRLYPYWRSWSALRSDGRIPCSGNHRSACLPPPNLFQLHEILRFFSPIIHDESISIKHESPLFC